MYTCSCFESSSLRRLLGGYLPFFPLNLLLLLLYPCSPNNSSNKYKLKKYKGKENTSCSHIKINVLPTKSKHRTENLLPEQK